MQRAGRGCDLNGSIGHDFGCAPAEHLVILSHEHVVSESLAELVRSFRFWLLQLLAALYDLQILLLFTVNLRDLH